MDDHQKLRELVAREFGIKLYRSYAEKEAMGLLADGGFRHDYSWYKRHRKAGHLPHILHGGEDDERASVTYLGVHLVDIIIRGRNAMKAWNADGTPKSGTIEQWADTNGDNFNSEDIGFPSEATPQRGTERGLTTDAPSARALAQRILKKPSKS